MPHSQLVIIAALIAAQSHPTSPMMLSVPTISSVCISIFSTQYWLDRGCRFFLGMILKETLKTEKNGSFYLPANRKHATHFIFIGIMVTTMHLLMGILHVIVKVIPFCSIFSIHPQVDVMSAYQLIQFDINFGRGSCCTLTVDWPTSMELDVVVVWQPTTHIMILLEFGRINFLMWWLTASVLLCCHLIYWLLTILWSTTTERFRLTMLKTIPYPHSDTRYEPAVHSARYGFSQTQSLI